MIPTSKHDTTNETAIEGNAELPLQLPASLKDLVEALIFAAPEPLSVRQLKAIYEWSDRNDPSRRIDAETIRHLVAELNAEYEKAGRPYRIVAIAGGFQFATGPDYAGWIGKLYKEQTRRKLSQSGVETLSIIAYKQPVTKSEIEAIRGVDCDYVLKTLLEKDLVTVTGRAETVGRPLLYGTTREFLKHFGLNEITDLPRPREIEEILGESQFETERRMLESQAGAEEEKKKDEEEFESLLPHIPKRKPQLTGDVEIVPRTRAREIRKVQSETPGQDQKRSEELEHGSPIAPEQAGADEPAQRFVAAETQNPPPAAAVPSDESVAEVEPLTPEAIAGPPIESATGEPDLVAPLLGERAEEAPSAPPSEARLQDGIDIDPSTQSHTSTEPSPLTVKSPQTRWESWRKKIQGIIRRLFG
ncbi:MAG TPA: SMC-Scp complex subunit ScpB [Bacteroidota bacterium]|nr:SMC-Scp complex subunit ScpB [Bacteroidota bacterium]